MLGKTHVANALTLANLTFTSLTVYCFSHEISAPILSDTKNFLRPFNQLWYLLKLNLFNAIDLLQNSFSTNIELVLSYLVLILLLFLFSFSFFKKKSHKKSGFMFYLIVSSIICLFFLLILPSTHFMFNFYFYMCTFIIGVFLPDVDSRNSVLGRYVPFISDVIPHRKVTHTIWVLIGLLFVSLFFHSYYLFFLTLGYVTHMIQDTPSDCGVCWFFPIIGSYREYGSGAMVKKGHEKMPSYTVGGMGETMIFWISICFLCLNSLWFIGYFLHIF